MAEVIIRQEETPGIAKEIDSGAFEMVFSALQEDIYSRPIKSFVRETISNCLDAVIERDIAKDILNGADVAKYYRQEQDGKLLKDSAFQKDYYDTEHLSTNKYVEVDYLIEEPRDRIVIKDHGVGLGGERLKGWFSIGYSTKRNMKLVRGKFGMGSKAGLATGVEYFTMTTVYNGYKTRFMIYKHDYEPVTPKTENGKMEQWNVKYADGTSGIKEIYWERTMEKNGVTVELSVKKHNRQKYIDAVIKQFEYFKDCIKFKYPFRHSDEYNEIILDVEPIYESDNLVIPSTAAYTAPHVLVDGISYGPVVWEELELERRRGGIAIKVEANEVDITQNRESLKWTAKTRDTVLKAVEHAKEEAIAHVAALLASSSGGTMFEIIRAGLAVSKSSDDTVSYTFSRFLDMTDINPVITLKGLVPGYDETKISLDSDGFRSLFYYHTVSLVKYTPSNGSRILIKKERLSEFSELSNSIVVYGEIASLSQTRVQQICNENNTNTFIYIRKKPGSVDLNFPKDIKGAENGSMLIYLNAQLRGLTYFLDTMPELYNDDNDEIGEEIVVQAQTETLASIRRRNQEVLYTTFAFKPDRSWRRSKEYIRTIDEKTDVKIADIPQHFSDDRTTIVALARHKELLPLFEMVHMHEVDIIFTAEGNLKYFLPHCIYIEDYLRTYNAKTKTIMVGEKIRELNTVRKIKELFKKYEDVSEIDIIENFTDVDITPVKRIYHLSDRRTTIKETLTERYEINEGVMCDVLNYLEKLSELQDIAESGDTKALAKRSQELLGGEILHVNSYDKELYDHLESELQRLEPLGPILKCLDVPYEQEDKDKIEVLINKILPLI